MIMNIPIRLQIHDLAYLVKNSIGESSYDYIRLPQDDGISGCNKGYAFVNCTSSEAVLYFWMKWHRKSWHDICPNSQKKCEISFAHNQLPARLQNTQHHVGDNSERIKNVDTVRARGTDGAQKESRRERRIRHVQAQQQAETACGDLTKGVDSSTTKCVGVDGKGRARTAVVGADVSDGDKGDDGGGDGGDDGGGDGGEDGGGPGSSGSDGAMHCWMGQTETAEAAPATGLPAAEILDDVATATAKVSSLVTGRRHPLPSDRAG